MDDFGELNTYAGNEMLKNTQVLGLGIYGDCWDNGYAFTLFGMGRLRNRLDGLADRPERQSRALISYFSESVHSYRAWL